MGQWHVARLVFVHHQIDELEGGAVHEPRFVRRSSGRQASGMSAMVMKGEGMVQPISAQVFSR